MTTASDVSTQHAVHRHSLALEGTAVARIGGCLQPTLPVAVQYCEEGGGHHQRCHIRASAHSTSPPSTLSIIFDAYILVDSTFIPLPRTPFPSSHYHPRSPTRSAWTVQIACDLSHRIVNVLRVERGAEADITVLLNSGLLEQADRC